MLRTVAVKTRARNFSLFSPATPFHKQIHSCGSGFPPVPSKLSYFQTLKWLEESKELAPSWTHACLCVGMVTPAWTTLHIPLQLLLLFGRENMLFIHFYDLLCCWHAFSFSCSGKAAARGEGGGRFIKTCNRDDQIESCFYTLLYKTKPADSVTEQDNVQLFPMKWSEL